MSIEFLKHAASVLYRANIPLFVVGAHGIGKTSGIYQLYLELAAEKKDLALSPDLLKTKVKVTDPDVVDVTGPDVKSLSSIDGRHLARLTNEKGHFGFWSMSAPNVTTEELIGMPHITDHGALYKKAMLDSYVVASNLLVASKLPEEEKLAQHKKVRGQIFREMCEDLGLKEEDRDRVTLKYLRPGAIMPPAEHVGGGIWLIDELNRGFIEVEKALMQILLERRYLDYTLPDDVWVCTTMNPPGANYQVRELDPATLDRGAVISVRSDMDSWLQWASKRKLADHTRLFGDKHRKLVNKHETDMSIDVEVGATMRSLEFADRAWAVMTEQEVKDVGMPVITSILGREAGNMYYKEATEVLHRPLRADEVLKKYGWRADMDKDAARDFKAWKVTPERARLRAMVKKTNVKTELLKITLDELTEKLKAMHEELKTRGSTRDAPKLTAEEEGAVLNVLLFLLDIPADLSRRFIKDDMDGYFELLFYWSGRFPICREVFNKIKRDYEKAEKEEA